MNKEFKTFRPSTLKILVLLAFIRNVTLSIGSWGFSAGLWNGFAAYFRGVPFLKALAELVPGLIFLLSSAFLTLLVNWLASRPEYSELDVLLMLDTKEWRRYGALLKGMAEQKGVSTSRKIDKKYRAPTENELTRMLSHLLLVGAVEGVTCKGALRHQAYREHTCCSRYRLTSLGYKLRKELEEREAQKKGLAAAGFPVQA